MLHRKDQQGQENQEGKPGTQGQELDSTILGGPFQLRTVCDSKQAVADQRDREAKGVYWRWAKKNDT